MDRATRRYMETLDKLLMDYAFAGIQALATVPDFLVQSANQPTPMYHIVFRRNGELYGNFGAYESHQLMLLQVTTKK